jgi:hypothetical protein
VVIVDPKASPALEATVRSRGGKVWTLEGLLPADVLDPPTLAGAQPGCRGGGLKRLGRTYRDAAHERTLSAAWALALQGKPLDLAQLRRLLDREELRARWRRTGAETGVSGSGSIASATSAVGSMIAVREVWTAR